MHGSVLESAGYARCSKSSAAARLSSKRSAASVESSQSQGRDSFLGRIVKEGTICTVSMPGKYPTQWDLAVQSMHRSLACVFCTDEASGLGGHVKDPENPQNHCYCTSLYGKVPWETYLSVLRKPETDEERAAFLTVFAFRRADAKAMNQIFLAETEHSPDVWAQKLRTCTEEAKQRWAETGGRAPWGCKWFDIWTENVLEAVRWKQQLVVYYFDGKVGHGKVQPPDLPILIKLNILTIGKCF